ncbi:MAG: NPCBM/NEW2 domain-containing protein, partial [Nakamurella sp.]
AWNDPDILQVGLGGMTQAEDQAHMSMWAVLAAPLLAGNDLRSMSAATKAILMNKDVIAVDQDRLGVQGRRITKRGDADVWSKPLANGDRAVLLVNRGAGDLTVQTSTAQVGLPKAKSYAVRDLWTHTTTESGGTIVAGVPAHSAVLVRVSVKGTPNPATGPTTGLSLAVPGLPGVSQPIVVPGAAGRLTSTFTNGGAAAVHGVRVTTDAPDGWTITPAAPATAKSVKPGAQLVSRWRLTPPSTADPGSYSVIADVTYSYGANGRKVGHLQARLVATVPQTPPDGQSWLSDLPWLSAVNGYGPPVLDKNYQGKPLTIRGTVYPKGVWTNAAADLTYYVGGHCSAFTSAVGIDDITAGKGSVDYQLVADGTTVYDSGTVTGSSPTATATADLTGVKVLQLVVTDAGDGVSYDNADWGGAALTCG